MRTGILIASLFAATAAFAAANTDNVRLADNVVPAPFGYEAATPKYTVRETTQIYVSPFIYPGAIDKTRLMPGTAVTVLAKAKDYDWVLVGKDGIGIGYIPLSRLASAK